MRVVHVTEIIDRKGLGTLADDERELVEVHAAECAECAEALFSARFALGMLRSHSETVKAAPPAFFETRVLAAIREKNVEKLPFWSFRRWWQASYGMVSAMVLIAAVLGMLTLFAPASNDQADMSNYSIYSTEADILNQRSARDLSREQLLEVIYSGKKDQGKR